MLEGVNIGRSQPAFSVGTWSGAHTSALIALRDQQSGAAGGIRGCMFACVCTDLLLDANEADLRLGSFSHLDCDAYIGVPAVACSEPAAAGEWLIECVSAYADRCRLRDAKAGCSFWPVVAVDEESVTICFVLPVIGQPCPLGCGFSLANLRGTRAGMIF
jgi:hypothetical protein